MPELAVPWEDDVEEAIETKHAKYQEPIEKRRKGPSVSSAQKGWLFCIRFFITGEAKKMAIKTMSEAGF